LESDKKLKEATKALSALCLQQSSAWFPTFVQKYLISWLKEWQKDSLKSPNFGAYIDVIGKLYLMFRSFLKSLLP